MLNDIDHARDALFHLDAGCARDEWVRLGMAAKSAGLNFDDFNNWSASAGNYSGENECRAAWESFDESGAVTRATLFGMAFAQGWKDPSKTRTKENIGSRPYQPQGKAEKTEQEPPKRAASGNAVAVWERRILATLADAYVHLKQGEAGGLGVYPTSAPPLVIRGQNVAGYLMVPCYAPDGVTLLTIQFIPPDGGDKLNLPGASFGDGYHVVGNLETARRIDIVEGLGQAWAVVKADPASAAVVCFGSGRMARIAKVLRAKYPAAALVIVADRGKETEAAKIAAAISGTWVGMPADKSSNYDANDYAQEFGTDALTALLERPQAPLMRYKMLSGADLYNKPPMPWRVRGVFPAEGLAALFGASGTSKSFLELDIGCAVSGGDDEWFGLRVTQAPVTYVCLEGEAGMGKRVKAWSQYHKKPLPDSLRFITQSFDLLSDDVQDLAKAIIAGGGAGGIVIIDTLNRAAAGADENSSVDMGKMIAAAKELQTLVGGLILLSHHTGKDQSKGLRGHSSLYAALDGAIEVTNNDGVRSWSVAKSKDDVTGDVYQFKLEIVKVGIDEEGEEITSCVIVPDESGAPIQKKKPSLGRNQKLARNALGEPLRNSIHIGKDGAPPGRPCIAYDDAVEIVAKRMPTDAKHQKSRAKEAIAGLIENGYMDMKGEWLWDK